MRVYACACACGCGYAWGYLEVEGVGGAWRQHAGALGLGLLRLRGRSLVLLWLLRNPVFLVTLLRRLALVPYDLLVPAREARGSSGHGGWRGGGHVYALAKRSDGARRSFEGHGRAHIDGQKCGLPIHARLSFISAANTCQWERWAPCEEERGEQERDWPCEEERGERRGAGRAMAVRGGEGLAVSVEERGAGRAVCIGIRSSISTSTSLPSSSSLACTVFGCSL